MVTTPKTSRNGLTVLDEFTTDMERVFDSLLGRTVGTVLRANHSDTFLPALDISETAESYQVSIDLPGVQPEDVKLELVDGRLTIEGKREIHKSENTKSVHRVERVSGSFSRSIQLPSEVDSDAIDAHYANGVLHVTLPKSAKQQPKKIEIRSSN